MNEEMALNVLRWNIDMLGADFYGVMGMTEFEVAKLKSKLRKRQELTQSEYLVLLMCVRFCVKLSLNFSLHFSKEHEVRMGTKFLSELKDELTRKVVQNASMPEVRI